MDVWARPTLGGYAPAPIECQDVPASRTAGARRAGAAHGVGRLRLHARPQSWRVASRAPSARAATFSQATLGWTALNRMPEAAKPQSAPALTLWRPTIRANRTMRSAIRSGRSTRLVARLITPGVRPNPAGGWNCSKRG